MQIKDNPAAFRIWRDYDLKIVYAGQARMGKEWSKEMECSPFSRIYYISDGDGYLCLNGEKVPLKRGCGYLIPAGLQFGYGCERYMEQLFIHINVTRIINGMDFFRGCDRIYEQDDFPEDIMRLLFSDNLAAAFRLKGLIWEEVSRFAGMGAVGTEYGRTYSRLVEQMFSLAGNPVSAANHVRSLAQRLHVSESTLSRRFRAETGMTPGAYLDQLVLERSCSLLLSGEGSIGQIAEELGFSDQFYFTRYFKQKMNTSPSAYRKQARMG